MLCIGFAAEHWDIIDGERGFMLGLRPRGSRKEGGSSKGSKHGSAQGRAASLGRAVAPVFTGAPASASAPTSKEITTGSSIESLPRDPPQEVLGTVTGSSIESPLCNLTQEVQGLVAVSPAPAASQQLPLGQGVVSSVAVQLPTAHVYWAVVR